MGGLVMYKMTVHSKFLHTPIFNKTLTCDSRIEATVLAFSKLKSLMGTQLIALKKVSTNKHTVFVRGQFAGELILRKL